MWQTLLAGVSGVLCNCVQGKVHGTCIAYACTLGVLYDHHTLATLQLVQRRAASVVPRSLMAKGSPESKVQQQQSAQMQCVDRWEMSCTRLIASRHVNQDVKAKLIIALVEASGMGTHQQRHPG